MNSLDEMSDYLYWGIFFGVILYFVLLGYSSIVGDQEVLLLSQVVFGVVAIGVGASLYLQVGSVGTEQSSVLGAAVCLVIGGLLKFVFLVAFLQSLEYAPAIDQASSFIVLAGIGLYIYSVWIAD
ncbi:hypothetical protein ACLI4Z_06950 [Natrialbaceae archaeon A-arb3/5]